MNNRISTFYEEPAACPANDVQPIGEILDQLLAQYVARFPDVRLSVVETSASAI
jgi:hypothetical protein